MLGCRAVAGELDDEPEELGRLITLAALVVFGALLAAEPAGGVEHGVVGSLLRHLLFSSSRRFRDRLAATGARADLRPGLSARPK
jgi:hypothetical protein